MTTQTRLTLKVFALIALEDLLGIVAQLMMKKGILATGLDRFTLEMLGEFFIRGVASPLLWVGILIYMVNFFIWILILYKIDISIAAPLGSFGYILVPLAAMMFLRERVGPVRWAGIVLIILGIYTISKTKHFGAQRDERSAHA